jgi:O-antigen/teichoic acid export membrane protein
VKDFKDTSKSYTGKSIAKNTIYNLIGYGIPLVFALIIIPFLIKGLGTEKFGLLNLAFVVIGYFSFFDFGIGRALTKFIAEKLGTNQVAEIPSIFWTSLFLMFLISALGSLFLLFFAPSLVHSLIKISKPLQTQSLKTLYLLALSIPVVTTTAGIRGALEAYQKFGVINIIRTFLGISMFLVPLLCLIFTNNLFWIIFFLVLVRVAVWILYLLQCFKINIDIKNKISFELKLAKPILKLSGWMTVSNIIVPVLIYLDRFLIGALVSATAIAYYATPYEAITKLLLVPGALIAVLFPAFSATYLSNSDYTKKLSLRAVKYIFIFLFPFVFLIITFAHELMGLWLGIKFAENSTFVLQLLSLGVFFNGIAYIPFTYLQGVGRPDITAKVNLIELPFYFIGMWLAVKYMGIDGAALVWMIRMFVDGLILFLFSKKIISAHFEFKVKSAYIYIFILIIASVFAALNSLMYLKIILASAITFSFLFIAWKFLLLHEERIFLTSYIRIFKFKGNV